MIDAWIYENLLTTGFHVTASFGTFVSPIFKKMWRQFSTISLEGSDQWIFCVWPVSDDLFRQVLQQGVHLDSPQVHLDSDCNPGDGNGDFSW